MFEGTANYIVKDNFTYYMCDGITTCIYWGTLESMRLNGHIVDGHSVSEHNETVRRIAW